jgi:ketosteroid isomerase-like protein
MADFRQEVQAVLRAIEAALERGADANEITDLLYDEDVVVVGEGWPSAKRGRLAMIPELAALMKEWGSPPRLIFSLVEPVMHSSVIAITLVEVKVVASGERYRIVYGWKQTTRGWRAKLEMFQGGTV